MMRAIVIAISVALLFASASSAQGVCGARAPVANPSGVAGECVQFTGKDGRDYIDCVDEGLIFTTNKSFDAATGTEVFQNQDVPIPAGAPVGSDCVKFEIDDPSYRCCANAANSDKSTFGNDNCVLFDAQQNIPCDTAGACVAKC